MSANTPTDRLPLVERMARLLAVQSASDGNSTLGPKISDQDYWDLVLTDSRRDNYRRRAEALIALARENQDEPGVDYKAMPAETKVETIKAMGFIPMGDPHTRDCPTNYGTGFICTCVPDATVWAQPADVDAFRGETWEQRLAQSKARDRRRQEKEDRD